MAGLANNAPNYLTDESSCHKNEVVQVMHLPVFPELQTQQDCERKIWRWNNKSKFS